jgi:hypothetical protein
LSEISKNPESINKEELLDFLNFESLLEKIDELDEE